MTKAKRKTSTQVQAKQRLRTTKTTTPQDISQIQALLEASQKRENALRAEGRYQEALDICLQITGAYPQVAGPWLNAAINYVMLTRWQEAIHHAQAALKLNSNDLGIYDALAHAHGALEEWDEARRYGLQALDIRAKKFGGEPVLAWPNPPPLPPPPSAQTRERNLIAFSLFGRDSKYCETAIVNVQEQPDVYPYWTCRFYVDDSVPDKVIARLTKDGAQIVPVKGAAAEWPGPMWRLLALDDPQVHRILFRDADSIISRREAAAVDEWLTSGKRFHIMRDWGSHTELMLAGLWGMVAGSLPPLDALMQRFMSTPLESQHFADQYFLRQYVWPYARASLMQHDSLFGFMDAVPFPDRERRKLFHVGCLEALVIGVKTNLPDGTEATWKLFRLEQSPDGQSQETLVCAYHGVVKDGEVRAYIPKRYAQWIEEKTALVRLVENDGAGGQARV